jgi:hypothetical protein
MTAIPESHRDLLGARVAAVATIGGDPVRVNTNG